MTVKLLLATALTFSLVLAYGQNQQIEVEGTVKVSNTDDINPDPGTIRWNGEDFEGWNGFEWVSFTKSSTSWGNQVFSESASISQSGQSLSSSGVYTAIGEPDFNNPSTENGKVTIIKFNGSGIQLTESIFNFFPQAAAGDHFGASVSLFEDDLAVGAPNFTNGAGNPDGGKVFLFSRDGEDWNLDTTLVPIGSKDQFGINVALHGDHLMVSTSHITDDNNEVYFYERTNGAWDLANLISFPTGVVSSIDLHDSYAAVGLAEENSNEGLVKIYERSGASWSFLQDVSPSDGTPFLFGSKVSISNEYLAASGEISNDPLVYIFRRDGSSFNETQILEPLSNEEDVFQTAFGASIDLTGNLLCIGDPTHAEDVSGRIFIFQLFGTTWQQTAAMKSGQLSRIGQSVSITDEYSAATENGTGGGTSDEVHFFIRN